MQLSNSRITLGFFTFLSLYAKVSHKRPYQPKIVKKKHFPSENYKQENSEHQTINDKQESNHYSTREEEFKKTETQNTQSKQLDSNTIKAFRMLGLLPGTPLIDVKRNYRLLVKQYHPDLFSQNHELMKKFTEKKIRDINKAYDQIVKWFSLS
ncbi:MAG: J domain-containing protein [Candidatus Pacearchaeota archaeon]|nr:J domain-containing protein [Candidatus Pacearchaeota archaeon]